MSMFESFKNAFYTWKYFHLPLRKLHILAWHLQNEEIESVKFTPASIKRLNFLNNKRINIQEEIGNISKDNDACKKCMGWCCIANYNFFGAIDFLARKYSNNPLKDYGEIWKPAYNYFVLRNHLKNFFSILGLWKSSSEEKSKLDKACRCTHLTEKGCIFSYVDRPIRCLAYTCRAFRESLQNDEFIKLAYLTKELQSVGYEIFELYKTEKTEVHLKILFQYWICI